MSVLICIDFDKTLININTNNTIANEWILPIANKDVLVVNGIIKEEDKNNNYNESKVTLKAQELLDRSNFKDNKDKIKKTFEELLSEGNKIAITSFNRYPKVIKLFLDGLGVDEKYKDNINIVCGFPIDMENGKIEHIEKAKELAKVENNTQVILVDDDIKNINRAERCSRIISR